MGITVGCSKFTDQGYADDDEEDPAECGYSRLKRTAGLDA